MSLTDPPQVPSGTQALYINYSSLSVHLNYDGSSEWVPVNATGRLDLMGLINVSQVLGSVEIKPNSTVDMVRFNITSSSITIDNTTYPVQVLGKRALAKVDSKPVNKSSNILLDFSPVVVPMYSQESTTFVLLPSLKIAVVLDPGLRMKPLPAPDPKHARYPVQQYNDLFRGGDGNLMVSNATLHSYDNYTSLSMTLLNNGGSNVTVLAVLVRGNGTPSEMSNATIVNGTAIVNESDIRNEQRGAQNMHSVNGNMPMGPDMNTASKLFQHNGSNFSINESAIREAGAYLGVNSVLIRMPGHSGDILVHDIGSSSGMHSPFGGTFVINRGMIPMRSSGIDFLVSGNGTLFMPSPRLMAAPMPRPGYLLMPKSSATLSYNGVIRIMEGGLSITLPSGNSYEVMVVTNKGIIRTNITST